MEIVAATGAVVAGALAGAAVTALWFTSRNKKIKLFYQQTEDNQETVKHLSQFLDPNLTYPALWWLTNGHVETIFAAFTRKKPGVKYVRELVKMSDGGLVALDWRHPFDRSMLSEKPLVILMPGLTGGSHDNYIQFMVQVAEANGMRAVVMNGRGTSDTPVITPQFYSASFTGDVREIAEYLAQKWTMANGGNGTRPQIAAIGWSLGANILVNYLGEEGSKTPITCAVSLCNPFELVICDKNFRKGFNRIYDQRLGTGLAKILKQHVEVLRNRDGLDLEMALNAKTVRDFDEAVTRRVFGWKSVDAYYAGSGSCDRIQNVRIPLLCVQAADDPIAIQEAIPVTQIENNENCILYVTPYGGHLGWVAGKTAPFGAPWPDELVINYLKYMFSKLVQQQDAESSYVTVYGGSV
eukprot:TRINITY_DN14807_c0_g1_i1.p1 TRINITY_DN14807_c0_g1~~TRINITY_DN14807_c0_g1_i1.p1  ORF type:complete len:455 (-),score=59.69 TRINITY_DN14807_c0_g1_i1:247-1476(-)